MNVFKYLTPLFIAPILTFSESSLAQNINQKLTMRAKPSVVRIVGFCQGQYKWYPDGKVDSNGNQKDPKITVQIDKDFIGTGFLINPNGYIATSANVMEFEKDCEQSLKRNIKNKIKRNYKAELTDSYIDDPKTGSLNIDFSNHHVYLPSTLNYTLNSKNRKPFEIKVSGRDQGESTKINRDVAIIKVSLENAPALKLGNSSEVRIQDPVITVGYPKSADLELDEDLTQESYFEASVQAGRISNPNKEIEGGYPVFQVDIRAAEGSAGSPIINNKGEVVGMLTYKKAYNFKNDVVPIAIPSSTLREFIGQSGGSNKQSEIDALYYDGLKDLWKENYKEARVKFVRVKGLFSLHSEVDRLISKIDQIEAERWASPWKNPFYQMLFAIGLGGIFVAGAVHFSVLEKIVSKKKSNDDKQTPTKNGTLFPPTTIFIELEFQGKTLYKSLVNSEHRLGRNPNWADLKVPESWLVVSNKHAILKKDGEDYCIYDGDGDKLSTNGIWENDDKRVDPIKGHILRNGDTLKIGQIKDEQVTLTYFNPKNEKDRKKTTRMANLDNRENDKN